MAVFWFFIQILVASMALAQEISFETFVKKFGFDWQPESREWQERKSLFEKETARVAKHNAAGHSWKEGINKFSAYTEEEKKVFLTVF